MPGKLIAIEGLDGAGTTTQTQRLGRRLQASGREVTLTREPSDGVIGKFVRASLGTPDGQRIPPGALALLFAADRAEHVASELAPALGRGQVVVTDRYVMSSLAYQSLDAEIRWVGELNRLAPKPDLTVLVRVSPKTALARIAARAGTRDRFESPELLARVAAQYELALSFLLDDGQACASVDGEGDPDRVEAAIWAAVEPIIAQP